MDDIPERIWVFPELNQFHFDSALGASDEFAGKQIEYLRADHVSALLAEERRRALADAYQAAHDATAHPSAYACRDAIRALSDAPAQRCAECDCENGEEDCNWIAVGPAPAREVTVREDRASELMRLSWDIDARADEVARNNLPVSAYNELRDVAKGIRTLVPDDEKEAVVAALSQGGGGND
ncbi:hypothetical protein JF540_22700 [Salipiger thiooxidans]|uniref:hypothetical protein n=1 Tax=Salipiger thiooxidans TaxID=282683 RepID=UPI001A907789|nr:hypothetical protein [Salipiger thiooxidans]MBN8189499.1 hypothetical protein [Salipiger thiooxidans]